MDCFFLEGVRVLFQVGLAILKVNGDSLLKVRDDGELMNVLKQYFATLGNLENDRGKQTTRFNQLMLVAYREFQNVTNADIFELRKQHQLQVVHSIDLYAKKTAARSLKRTGKFSKEEVLFLCDCFYSIQYYADQRGAEKITCGNFRALLSDLTDWAVSDAEDDPTMAAGELFIAQLFSRVFDLDKDGLISLQDLVSGLGELIDDDPINVLKVIFRAHDGNQDGVLTHEETIQMSSTFLYLFRKDSGDKKLGAISSFMNRAFMVNATAESEQMDLQKNILSFELFKELVTADDLLSNYFTDFHKKFRLVSNSVHVEQTFNAPPIGEISQQLFKGGIQWAQDKMLGKKVSSLALDENEAEFFEEGIAM
jgi:Ca2+-binding EF-hand superfamily protein